MGARPARGGQDKTRDWACAAYLELFRAELGVDLLLYDVLLLLELQHGRTNPLQVQLAALTRAWITGLLLRQLAGGQQGLDQVHPQGFLLLHVVPLQLLHLALQQVHLGAVPGEGRVAEEFRRSNVGITVE